ncbi:Lrp/AsnC family transcriptional regulator [Reyranella sp.]|uniref:Lrp/AsnC family transcriptional regulator n=1 Tax=Reyranella sp. TaxID=1929291 RepID=UPI003BAD5521
MAHEAPALDLYDRRILSALQDDGALTNQALADRVHLSASQCSRRRQRLEADGLIRGYRADLDAARLGLTITVYVNVMLDTHSPENADRFQRLVTRLPEVQEAHALTGDMDYLLKIVVADLPALSQLINGELLPHQSVSTVKSSIVLSTLKADHRLPIAE